MAGKRVAKKQRAGVDLVGRGGRLSTAGRTKSSPRWAGAVSAPEKEMRGLLYDFDSVLDYARVSRYEPDLAHYTEPLYDVAASLGITRQAVIERVERGTLQGIRIRVLPGVVAWFFNPEDIAIQTTVASLRAVR